LHLLLESLAFSALSLYIFIAKTELAETKR
jgi:hypothetical protein